jgi:hypothetical protein
VSDPPDPRELAEEMADPEAENEAGPSDDDDQPESDDEREDAGP